MYILEDESTKELNKQLKEINEILDSQHPQFKSKLWLLKLRIIKELSYRKKKWNISASDDSPLPIVVKAPSPPAGPIPIPYPNIGKGAEKVDSKSKENPKRVDKDFDRRRMLRFGKGSKYKKSD